MNEKQIEAFNILYIILKKNDVEILKHFCDESISDQDYFSYGIKNEIVSNALSILINYLSGNLETPGIDNSCRMIYEALVIRKIG